MTGLFYRFSTGVVLCLLMTGCATTQTAEERLPVTRKAGSAFYYQCTDGSGFPAEGSERGITLSLPDGKHKLVENTVASGFHYSDGKVSLQGQGDQAILTVSGKHRSCQIDRRKSLWEDSRYRGADLVAMGNEPGWKLELSLQGDMLYIGSYGTESFRMPTPRATRSGNGPYVFAARDAEHSLWVSIEGKPCQDTMKGDRFEFSVNLIADGKPLEGCAVMLNPFDE